MPSTATPNLLQDPGYLFWAPIGSSEPVNTVVGSVFTDSWPVAWINLGATEDGSVFKTETNVEGVSVAELFDPVMYETVSRSSEIAFSLADWTLGNLKKALNGGTLSVVSGTTTTQLNAYTPPTPGTEVRAMIGWESLDATLRLICYQCFQGGSVEVAHKKRPEKALIPVTFHLEVPTSGIPFKMYSAGTARA